VKFVRWVGETKRYENKKIKNEKRQQKKENQI
jgi:hypothetical protein